MQVLQALDQLDSPQPESVGTSFAIIYYRISSKNSALLIYSAPFTEWLNL